MPQSNLLLQSSRSATVQNRAVQRAIFAAMLCMIVGALSLTYAVWMMRSAAHHRADLSSRSGDAQASIAGHGASQTLFVV